MRSLTSNNSVMDWSMVSQQHWASGGGSSQREERQTSEGLNMGVRVIFKSASMCR